MTESFEATKRRSDEIEADLVKNPTNYRVLTGERPTGHLHIGHYLGTLRNRVRLHRMGVPMFILSADYQVITDRDAPGPIRERVFSNIVDNIACGLDTEDVVFFAHSTVPELNQLLLPFLSLVTVPELQRNPTVKDEIAATQGRKVSGLLLTYPVHQAADILFCHANLVPAGRDQLPHLEVARLIARRFEERYGHGSGDGPIFVAPETLLSDAPLVLGLDGKKMAKSGANAIDIKMTADETAQALKKAVTDSDRRIVFDPDNRPEVSNLLLIAASCMNVDPRQVAEEVGDAGSGALKKIVIDAVNTELAPVRARRDELMKDPAEVSRILAKGGERAREIAQDTLDKVSDAIGMRY